MSTTQSPMPLFSGAWFGMDPPGDIYYRNEHTQFSAVIDSRYAPGSEVLPWAFSLRVRSGPSYPGEQRPEIAEIALTEAHCTQGTLQELLDISDPTLSVNPIGLY